MRCGEREAVVLSCRTERTGARTGRGAGGGGRRRRAGAWAAARPEVPARRGRLGGERARSLPRFLARSHGARTRLPAASQSRSPAGERRASPVGCNVGRPACISFAPHPTSSSSALVHLPLRLPLFCLFLLLLLFSISLSSSLSLFFLSSLSFPLLLPPQQTLVAPEATGSPGTCSCSRLPGMLLAGVELPNFFCSVLDVLAGVLMRFLRCI